VLDYGAGNLRSVVHAINRLGFDPVVTSDPEDVRRADRVILPGVGAAGCTVASLEKNGLGQAIGEYIAAGKPFLGVCIGLQVLLSYTQEGSGSNCLGIVAGQVKKLPPGLKIPHMGWNQVHQKKPHPIFKGIPEGANFYFVHSYYVEPEDEGMVAGETEYGVRFCSVLARGNLVATQFHPEKSGETGLKIYENFLGPAGGGLAV
jgi:glutamine amidotransferase